MQGYSRKGAALSYLRRYPDAEEAYRTGLEKDPENEQLKKGLEDSQEKKSELNFERLEGGHVLNVGTP